MRPTDGVSEGPAIRYRSPKREQYRRRLEAPDDLIVTAFLNACAPTVLREDAAGEWLDGSAIIEFVNRYGFLGVSSIPAEQVLPAWKLKEFAEKGGGPNEKIFTYADSQDRISLGILSGVGSELGEIWDAYAAGSLGSAVNLFRSAQDADVAALMPDMNLRGDRPVLSLQAGTLYGFMLMETALVVTGGAQIARCQNCQNIFATGSGTGRRNTAKYCSNRCRVAAQRNHKGGAMGTK